LPAAKVDEKTTHQSTSTAGDEEVGGRRRRRRINKGGDPGGQKAVARGEAEVATQQPVRVDDERHGETTGGGAGRHEAAACQYATQQPARTDE
jgi:hypothetical protein